MKIRLKETFEKAALNMAQVLGLIVGFIPAVIWIFIILEVLLFMAMSFQHIYWEAFIAQFPVTLWAILSKKDGK